MEDAHHADTPDNILNEDLFKNLIKERKLMYDHNVDKSGDKHSSRKDLSTYDFELLPNYIKNNKNLFKKWMV